MSIQEIFVLSLVVAVLIFGVYINIINPGDYDDDEGLDDED